MPWITHRANSSILNEPHHILLEKLTNSGLPRHIVRWIGAFLLDRSQQVKIGSICSRSGSPNGGVPQGTLSGPKCFFIVR